MSFRARIILASFATVVVLFWWFQHTTPTTEQMDNIIYMHNHPVAQNDR